MNRFRSFLFSALLAFTSFNVVWADGSAPAPLQIKVFNTDANSFHVSSVLVSGQRDAMLIDAQFTRADAHRLVAEVLASGKALKMVYVSHGDPDFYFGLEVIRAEFPDIAIYASQPTIDWITKTVDKKVAFWGPKMGANAPQTPIIPSSLPPQGLSLEGQRIEIKGLDGELPGRSYAWIPSIGAVVGGVNVFSGLHLWTADTQSKSERAAWVKTLEGIEALAPKIVIPGHTLVGAPAGLEAVAYSKIYLKRFEAELDKAPDAASLIDSMRLIYPDAGLTIALEIGAKVNTGEMKW